jgi:murein DD-endopeptidase MepM/ murein hydrolase activator NlpD
VHSALRAALALATVALTAVGCGGKADDRPAGKGGAQVVDLSSAASLKTASARPQESITEADSAAVERQLQQADDAATADDGISPGAPSDAEVRKALKQLREATAAGPVRAGGGSLIWPVRGPLTSPFGQRWGRLHAGIDIAAPTGRPIRAAATGRVVLMAPTGGYGLYTCVKHAGPFSTCYAHQSRFGTSRGASVQQGDVIGYVGNTGHSFGAHLHFEVRVNGRPVDPRDYL